MPIFPSTFAALEWAETVYSIREGGRSNAAMMEQLGNGGVPKDYDILDAIEIRAAAKRACWLGLPCPIMRMSCLFHWHLPDPSVQYPRLSDSHEQRIIDCDAMFEFLLRAKGFMERS